MDLLRMLSMIMVTMLHALGKGDLLLPMSADLPLNGWLAWILECFSISAVNIFMLISGYFLIGAEFKLIRFAELLFQVCFYSVTSFLVFAGAGLLQEEQKGIYHILQTFLPIHMDVYWFITAYVVIYLFFPVLAKGVKNVTRTTLRNTILGLLAYECLMKSILPFQLETDTKGYSFLWYLIMFMIGAYIRLYGIGFIKKAWQGWCFFFLGAVLSLSETFCLHLIYARTGRLGELLHVGMHYNHFFVLLAAVGIFEAFLHRKTMGEGVGRIICTLSPMTLGVYLFQECIVLRDVWQKWFRLPGSLENPTIFFLLKLFGAVLAMYLIGTVVDCVQILLFRLSISLFQKRAEKGEKA